MDYGTWISESVYTASKLAHVLKMTTELISAVFSNATGSFCAYEFILASS